MTTPSLALVAGGIVRPDESWTWPGYSRGGPASGVGEILALRPYGWNGECLRPHVIKILDAAARLGLMRPRALMSLGGDGRLTVDISATDADGVERSCSVRIPAAPEFVGDDVEVRTKDGTVRVGDEVVFADGRRGEVVKELSAIPRPGEEESPVAVFVRTMCLESRGSALTHGVVERYQKWCQAHDHLPVSRRSLVNEIRRQLPFVEFCSLGGLRAIRFLRVVNDPASPAGGN